VANRKPFYGRPILYVHFKCDNHIIPIYIYILQTVGIIISYSSMVCISSYYKVIQTQLQWKKKPYTILNSRVHGGVIFCRIRFTWLHNIISPTPCIILLLSVEHFSSKTSAARHVHIQKSFLICSIILFILRFAKHPILKY